MTLEIAVTDDFAACLALRMQVFVVEQKVPAEIERDEHDAAAIHLLARREGRPVGTARIVVAGNIAKIGRVCLLASERGRGAGAALMQACLTYAAALPGIRAAKLGAQVPVIGFYERLGFCAYGPVYLDAGIPHRDMTRLL